MHSHCEKRDVVISLSSEILFHIFSFLPKEKCIYVLLILVDKNWNQLAKKNFPNLKNTFFKAKETIAHSKVPLFSPIQNTSQKPLRKLPPIPTSSQTSKAAVDLDLKTTTDFPFILTLKELELSENEYICDLKKIEWTYTTRGDGTTFDVDVNRKLMVNNGKLLSSQVENAAKKFPLIKKYRELHTQQVMYLFNSAIWANVGKGNFIIYKNNHSSNIKVNALTSSCVTTNSLLIVIDPTVPVGEGKIFSIPGRIQTVFEMVTQPQLGLKLKVIKMSNSVLKRLVFEDFPGMNDELLDLLIMQAKYEESTTSLFNWYREQAKFFLGTKFARDFSSVTDCDNFVKIFLSEVKDFLESYSDAKIKYREFINQISMYFVKEKKKSEADKIQKPSYTSIIKSDSEKKPAYIASKQYQFLLLLYEKITENKKKSTIPLPVPTIGLDLDANLFIIFPPEAIQFKIKFLEFNRPLFNQFFNQEDEAGNGMALFNDGGEFVKFLEKCHFDLREAVTVAIELHTELSRNVLWQEMATERLRWENFMNQVALAFNRIPDRAVSDKVFYRSMQRKLLLEKSWQEEQEKNKNDIHISLPLQIYGLHKPSLLELFKSRINLHYQCGCLAINLTTAGFIMSLKHMAHTEMKEKLKKYQSVEYLDGGYKVKISSLKDIESFANDSSISLQALSSEIKFNLDEIRNTKESCIVM